MKKTDLKTYMVESKFKREFNVFFGYWEPIMLNRSVNPHKTQTRIEKFYGDFMQKFESLQIEQQEKIVNNEYPFNEFVQTANITFPRFFRRPQDDKDFVEVVKEHKFK